ncbi:hypothetical protein ACTI_84090 [Actinoplanes sp. OR16]|uniref:hypothetical protein n=1 Tax=Actinoplanes sp. OR16 TaxID=946334 RepID=UPI000F6F09EE|nr:hypothetical protein [Actinoplanes sp. OR16]BBH71724.1 hypothetical protein ACTI_84090 [Actinoplanes sp. OR16]
MDRGVRCEVCGHPVRSAGEGLRVCAHCYAVTEEGIGPWTYEPPSRRWERAEMPEPEPHHAYGFVNSTLCGLTGDDIVASPYPWIPERPAACPSCRTAAAVIDARWPAEKRLPRRIRSAADIENGAPPF